MATLELKQVKSAINRPKRQKDTLIALGLKGINKTVEHELTPQVKGMIKKVSHLIEITEK